MLNDYIRHTLDDIRPWLLAVGFMFRVDVLGGCSIPSACTLHCALCARARLRSLFGVLALTLSPVESSGARGGCPPSRGWRGGRAVDPTAPARRPRTISQVRHRCVCLMCIVCVVRLMCVVYGVLSELTLVSVTVV
jgi:hypothetical protein